MPNQEPGSTSLLTLTVYGEVLLNEPTLTLGSSTPMLHQTDTQICRQSTENINSKKSGPTNKEFVKLNMLHFPLGSRLLPGV